MFGWLKTIFKALATGMNSGAFKIAIETGDEKKVQSLLDSSPDVVKWQYGDNKGTALSYAASFRQPAIVRLLLENGMSASALDKSGTRAIHWAAVADVTETVEILLDAGEDINAPDCYGMTPLHWAAEIGSAPMVKCLLRRGANAKAVDRFGATVIHCLVEGGSGLAAINDAKDSNYRRWVAGAPMILELLVKRGADVNAHSQFHAPALASAAAKSNLKEFAVELCRHGAVNPAGIGPTPGSRQEQFQMTKSSGKPEDLGEARREQIVNLLVVILNQHRRDDSRVRVDRPTPNEPAADLSREPNPPDKVSIICECGLHGTVKAEYAGRTMKCPKCQRKIRVPVGGSSKPAPVAGRALTSPERAAATSPPVPKKPVNPDLVALAEKYMGMDYPSGPMDAMLAGLGGQSLKKPTYTVSTSGRIQRASESIAGMGSPIDMKIVQVASCLKGRGDLNMFDPQSIAKSAMDAVEHFAALPKVRKFFLAPYEAKTGDFRDGASVALKEQCRILAGVENLLLEIYEALPYDGSIITDALVENKIDQLVQSV